MHQSRCLPEYNGARWTSNPVLNDRRRTDVPRTERGYRTLQPVRNLGRQRLGQLMGTEMFGGLDGFTYRIVGLDAPAESTRPWHVIHP